MKQAVTPKELAALIITKSIDSCQTLEQLDTAGRMIDNFNAKYGIGVARELRVYADIRRQEIELKAKIKSNNRKLYDTHNFFTSLGQRRSSSNHDHACKVSV